MISFKQHKTSKHQLQKKPRCSTANKNLLMSVSDFSQDVRNESGTERKEDMLSVNNVTYMQSLAELVDLLLIQCCSLLGIHICLHHPDYLVAGQSA